MFYIDLTWMVSRDFDARHQSFLLTRRKSETAAAVAAAVWVGTFVSSRQLNRETLARCVLRSRNIFNHSLHTDDALDRLAANPANLLSNSTCQFLGAWNLQNALLLTPCDLNQDQFGSDFNPHNSSLNSHPERESIRRMLSRVCGRGVRASTPVINVDNSSFRN